MTTRTGWAAVLLAFTLACSGKDGANGRDGANGKDGANGRDGASTGTARGTVASEAGDPVAGATVTFTPGTFTATSGADGTYTLTLPAGVYSAQAERAGFVPATATSISVVVGQATSQNFTLALPTPEVTASGGADRFQAGFGAVVRLDASGSTAPPGATYSWQQISGPPATLSDPAAVQPTFTTLTLAELEPAGLFVAPERLGMVGVSAADALRLTYVFEVAVASGSVVSTAGVSIQSIPPQPGLPVTGTGALAAVGTRTGATYAWTCATVSGATETPCPAGVLDAATARVATFKPATPGSYLLRETVSGGAVPVTVAGYVGARPNPAATAPTCGSCHVAAQTASDGRTLTDKFTPWASTRHATFFRRAIDGGLPVPYEQSCIRCHTTGYNPEADNGGFDDLARAAGWTFPVPFPGMWDDLSRRSEQLANLGAVSCESCHGPGSAHAGAGGAPTAIARGFGVDTCAQCHAKEPYETQGLQWVNSKHAIFIRRALPPGGRPTELPFCASCHTAQGFVAWRRTGDPNQPAPAVGFAEPQTCIACHDPHGEAVGPDGQPTFRQLRVFEDVTTLTGVGARGIGAGAICLECHNRRESFSLATQAAPHQSCDGDIILAKGAEAFGAPYPTSAHGAVPQLCVGCHMAPTPPPGDPARNLVGGHTFAVRTDALEHVAACAGCHPGLVRFNRTAYGDYDGDGVVRGVHDETAGLLARVRGALVTRAAQLWPAETRTQGVATPNLGVVEQQGRIRVLGHFDPAAASPPTNDPQCDPALVGQDWPERCFAFPAGQIPVVAAGQQEFLRAAWNLILVERDRSRGVHNTAYTIAVLQRTYAAIAGAPVPGAVLR